MAAVPRDAPKLHFVSTSTSTRHAMAWTASLPAEFDPARANDLVRPSLLISYWYRAHFERDREAIPYRSWVMDSGAFSASSVGASIGLQEYIDYCKRMMDTDPTLKEIFGLDVIGDWRQGIRNVEEMWRQGVPAIPTYHGGEPEEALLAMRDYPKIALGGVAVGRSPIARKKREVADAVFGRLYPRKIHAFAYTCHDLLTYPFHSLDNSTWFQGPSRYGNWFAFRGFRGGRRKRGPRPLCSRGQKYNVEPEIREYLSFEQRARIKWATEMAMLDERCPYSLDMLSRGG